METRYITLWDYEAVILLNQILIDFYMFTYPYCFTIFLF